MISLPSSTHLTNPPITLILSLNPETEKAMHYKTIVLELLQQRTELHEQLRKERKLLKAMEIYANELKERHEAWKETLIQSQPASDRQQISSEALELAISELEDRLPAESPNPEADPLSLDAAMAFIHQASLKK
jgi:hypothetical protein